MFSLQHPEVEVDLHSLTLKQLLRSILATAFGPYGAYNTEEAAAPASRQYVCKQVCSAGTAEWSYGVRCPDERRLNSPVIDGESDPMIEFECVSCSVATWACHNAIPERPSTPPLPYTPNVIP